MWIYEQKNGRLRESDANGDKVAAADLYSGFGPGKNDPLAQHLPGVGPIPQGFYLLGSVEADEYKHGPVAIHLVPVAGQTFGRSGFMVHGDSKEHPGAASHGCIIAPRVLRERMALGTGNARLLAVVALLSGG